MVTQTHNFRVLQTNSMRFFKQISTINSMIFKTMDNELKVFGKTILTTTEHLKNLETVNATVYNKNGQFNLQGLSINTSQSVSNFTKLNNAFKAYNSNLTKSTQLQNAYIKAVGNQNGALGNYLAGLNGAKASMGGYIKSLIGAKAATIGLQVASTLLNAALSFGLSLALSAIVSGITRLVNKEKEAREQAIENAQTAKEEADNLTELLNKYNQLSEEVKTNTGAKDDLLETQGKLLESLGIEQSQLDGLIEKYGDLNTAINKVTLDSLNDAQADLMVAVDAREKELINVGKDYKHWYSLKNRNLISTGGDESKQAYDILAKAGVISQGSVGTGGGVFALVGDDKTVDGILENYQKLKEAQTALNEAVTNGEISKEDMGSNPLYKAINSRLDELKTAVDNYNSAIKDVNENSANQEIISNLIGKDLPQTEEEFETFKQNLIDSAQASNNFIGSQEDIKNSIIDALAEMPEFEKYFEDLAQAESDVQHETPISFTDALNSSEYADIKEKLLDLAKSGEITSETLSSTQEYNALLEEVGISAESAKDQILNMLSAQERLAGAAQGLSKLKSAYEEFKDKDIGFVTAETLESLPDVFKNLPEFDLFSKIAGNPESGKEKIQQAFNDIAKAYIFDQETLQGLADADSNTIQTYIANLKQIGVTNAEEVARTASEVLNSDNKMINDAEKEYNEYLENKLKGGEEFLKSTASQNSILKNALGSTYQSDYNNWCDLLSKKAGAYNKFVEAIGGNYDDSKSVIQNMLDNGIDITMSNLTDAYTAQAEYNRQVEEYKKLNDSLKIDLSPITTDFNVNYSSSSSSSSSSSNSDFDWIQVKLEAISRTTDKLQKKFEKTFTVNSATKKFKDYLSQINSEISANKTAGQTYLNYFNSVGLSSEWKNKIKSGKYKIDKNVDSATADKISEAQGYWNNYLQTLETINQLEDERESAEDTYANKVIDHYNKQIEKQQKLLDLREKFVSIRATWSDFANTASDYRYEQSKNTEQIKIYDGAITKYRSLQKTVTEGSDAWNTYNDQIKDNQDKIQELTLSNAELSKSIMNLPLDNASKKIEKYSNNLSLLQTKYNSLNMADSKNKNIDLQQKQSANIKAANDAALKEANANLNSAWTAVQTKAYDTFKTANKKAKKGDYLTQFSSTREGYKTIVDYNNALTAQKKAYEEAEKASAEYYRTVQENTKNKWDNIINQYQTNYDYFNSKSSRASAYLDYRKSMGYSNTSIYQENAYKDQLQAQKDALAELDTERGKLDWNKIQKQYEAGELQRDDYFALAKTIKELDSSIYKAKSDINETNAAINKIPFQRLEYQIGTLTNKQTELSNALSLKQKLNEAIKAEDYTSQINTNKQLEKLYISENEWLQEQLKTVSVNSDKWKEWSDAIASNESKINSLKQSNEDLKDSLRSEVYIKPFEKMATKIDFLKERLNSFLGLVNDTDTMFDDKGAFTKNGEAALGLSLKNIDAAKSKIENIQNKIQEAQKLYNNGNNDIGYSEEEYANDMRQYISDMWNAVSESKSASDEIVNIYQEQGQAILDALNKEIDARSKALQKKKEYYDYDKTIKTKTKDIQSLETQIAAMQSMEDSLEKRKKLLELQEELNEKQEDLKDTQLDHQINIVVNGLDDFSTKIQENFDDSVKELKTNLDKQAEIINEANRLYADSYNSIFEHLSKLMKYYGIDASKLPSDLKDTTIGDLKGFSRGGVARDLSGVIKQNGDSLLASINPNETVLTERFTELMPHAVNIMEGLIKTPVIPPSSVMQPNVNIQFNVDGNVDSVTWDTIKKEIPNISKQVQKDIYVDLKKSGALRK